MLSGTVPCGPGKLFLGHEAILEQHDPHSRLLERMMTSPKMFCDALVADHVLRHATKTHHIIAFALMVQLHRYLQGSHEPLFLQLVDQLDVLKMHEDPAVAKGANRLCGAVHFACALFASQDYSYAHDEEFSLQCVGCKKSLSADALMCSNCHLAPYCSNQCQEQHWHQHRRDCVKVKEFKQWIAEKAPLAKVGAFADSVCFNCGAVRGPVLHFGGVHGRWPAVLNSDTTMSKCSQCKHAHYCSEECQVTHWKAGHKAECSPATK